MKQVLVTPKKAERDRRNAEICAKYTDLRRRGGQKTVIYKYLAKLYGLDKGYVSIIIKRGGER